MNNEKIYGVWKAIKRRCFYKKCKNYKDYGGRGITICNEWKDNFLEFYNWSVSNGYKKGLTIDRIDVNGNYCPENCRWIIIKEQARNKRKTIYVYYNGEKMTLKDACEFIKIKYTKAYYEIVKMGKTYYNLTLYK